VSAPAPLRLRPLEIGDVLDETFRMYRRHFFLLAGLSVAFAIPLAAFAGFGIWSFFDQAISSAYNTTTSNTPDVSGMLVGLGIGYVVYFAVLPFQYGAITYAICESAQGRPISVGSVLRAALRRYLHVAGYLGLLILMALFFCLFPLWIWIIVGWIAVLPVMFVENVGLGAAMSRSWNLVRGVWWRTFLIALLVFILTYVVTLALDAFFYLGQALLSIVLSPYVTLAIYEAAGILVNALVMPVLMIALVLIYFDLRVRKEGLDLFQLAGRIASTPPALA
jgi:hypothetical protein